MSASSTLLSRRRRHLMVSASKESPLRRGLLSVPSENFIPRGFPLFSWVKFFPRNHNHFLGIYSKKHKREAYVSLLLFLSLCFFLSFLLCFLPKVRLNFVQLCFRIRLDFVHLLFRIRLTFVQLSSIFLSTTLKSIFFLSFY